MIMRKLKHTAIVALTATILAVWLSDAQAEDCEGKELFIVGLKIKGQAEDGFRIVGFCGNEEIVRCRATIEDGNTRDKCTAAEQLLPGTTGRKRCVIGPRNGNSAEAKVRDRTCKVE